MPYDWNKKKRLIELSKRGRIMMRLNFVLLLIAVCFCVGNCIRFHISNDYDNLNKTYMWTVAGLVVYYEEDGYSEFNSLLLRLRTMNPLYLPNHDPNTSKITWIIEGCLILIGFGCIGGILVSIAIIGIFPSYPIFLRSFFPAEMTGFNAILLPFIYLHPIYLIVILHWNYGIALSMYLIFGSTFVSFVVKEFRLGKESSWYKSSGQLRKYPTLCIEYRSVFIFLEEVLEQPGKMLIQTQAMATYFTVYALCILIRNEEGKIRIPTKIVLISWSFFAVVGWSLILWMGGWLYFCGQLILKSWKYHEWTSKSEKKYMNKFRKSCRPVTIHCGNLYTIRRLSVLKFIRGVLEGIFRTLLTLFK
ncbi:unnamed protein product [Orchesella dallaii]|uniref:Odorant receptor n=1 Tax=Orchesella dallaii TaxID=48710 RepID=A0ABP1RBM8_9HEXA